MPSALAPSPTKMRCGAPLEARAAEPTSGNAAQEKLEALPAAVDDIEEYEWLEGEVLGGTLLGWNFGDGHLNGEQLMNAIQPICQFEAGELRLISVESQPLFGPTMHWRVYCPVEGKLKEGKTQMADYTDHAPWGEGELTWSKS